MASSFVAMKCETEINENWIKPFPPVPIVMEIFFAFVWLFVVLFLICVCYSYTKITVALLSRSLSSADIHAL
jgi:hypothetical protein